MMGNVHGNFQLKQVQSTYQPQYQQLWVDNPDISPQQLMRMITQLTLKTSLLDFRIQLGYNVTKNTSGIL